MCKDLEFYLIHLCIRIHVHIDFVIIGLEWWEWRAAHPLRGEPITCTNFSHFIVGAVLDGVGVDWAEEDFFVRGWGLCLPLYLFLLFRE